MKLAKTLVPIVASLLIVASTFWAVRTELQHKAAVDAYVEYMEAFVSVVIHKANVTSLDNYKLAGRLIAAETRVLLLGSDDVISAIAAANQTATDTQSGGTGCERGKNSEMWNAFYQIIRRMAEHVGTVDQLNNRKAFAILCEYNV